MSTFERIPSRALDLVQELGSGLAKAVPHRALNWVETGAALGAMRTGTRVATRLVRRNPAMAAAAVAGAGLLWFAARQRAKRAEAGDGTIEGTATRIEAKKTGSGRTTSRKARTTA